MTAICNLIEFKECYQLEWSSYLIQITVVTHCDTICVEIMQWSCLGHGNCNKSIKRAQTVVSLSLRTVRSLARVFLDQCTLCQPLIIKLLYTNSLQGARTTDQILSASDQVEEKVLVA